MPHGQKNEMATRLVSNFVLLSLGSENSWRFFSALFLLRIPSVSLLSPSMFLHGSEVLRLLASMSCCSPLSQRPPSSPETRHWRSSWSPHSWLGHFGHSEISIYEICYFLQIWLNLLFSVTKISNLLFTYNSYIFLNRSVHLKKKNKFKFYKFFLNHVTCTNMLFKL